LRQSATNLSLVAFCGAEILLTSAAPPG
jgi:hypothetical protein